MNDTDFAVHDASTHESYFLLRDLGTNRAKKQLRSTEGEIIGTLYCAIFSTSLSIFLTDHEKKVRAIVSFKSIYEHEAWILSTPCSFHRFGKRAVKLRSPDLKIYCDWNARECTVVHRATQKVISTTARPNKDSLTYQIQVAAHVDVALITFINICVDMLHNRKHALEAGASAGIIAAI